MHFAPETVTVARAALGLISIEWLKVQQLRSEFVQRFEREFGDEMWLTRANLIRWARAGLKIEWLVDRILAGLPRFAFMRALAPINRIYYDDMGDANEAWLRRQVSAASTLADLLGFPPLVDEGKHPSPEGDGFPVRR